MRFDGFSYFHSLGLDISTVLLSRLGYFKDLFYIIFFVVLQAETDIKWSLLMSCVACGLSTDLDTVTGCCLYLCLWERYGYHVLTC